MQVVCSLALNVTGMQVATPNQKGDTPHAFRWPKSDGVSEESLVP